MSDKIKQKCVWLECKKCNCKEFNALRIVDYEGNWEDVVISEVLCHDMIVGR